MKVIFGSASKTWHNLIQKVLSPRKIDVVDAYTVKGIINKAIEQTPDIIILDVNLMNGKAYDVIPELSKRGYPIILMGFKKELDKKKTGNVTVLEKPFTVDDMLKAINSLKGKRKKVKVEEKVVLPERETFPTKNATISKEQPVKSVPVEEEPIEIEPTEEQSEEIVPIEEGKKVEPTKSIPVEEIKPVKEETAETIPVEKNKEAKPMESVIEPIPIKKGAKASIEKEEKPKQEINVIQEEVKKLVTPEIVESVVKQVAWEVVPELAEKIIREEVEKFIKERLA